MSELDLDAIEALVWENRGSFMYQEIRGLIAEVRRLRIAIDAAEDDVRILRDMKEHYDEIEAQHREYRKELKALRAVADAARACLKADAASWVGGTVTADAYAAVDVLCKAFAALDEENPTHRGEEKQTAEDAIRAEERAAPMVLMQWRLPA